MYFKYLSRRLSPSAAETGSKQWSKVHMRTTSTIKRLMPRIFWRTAACLHEHHRIMTIKYRQSPTGYRGDCRASREWIPVCSEPHFLPPLFTVLFKSFHHTRGNAGTQFIQPASFSLIDEGLIIICLTENWKSWNLMSGGGPWLSWTWSLKLKWTRLVRL